MTIRAGLLLLCSLLLMTLDHRQHHLETIRAGLSTLLYPLQYTVDVPVVAARWAAENLASHSHLLQENQRLKQEQLEASVKLQRLEALLTENRRLRQLLQSSDREWERVLIGELLSVDLDPFKRTALINRGSNDGVYIGHPLIDAHGVIGQVIHVSPMTSEIMLITDPSHGIPVQVNRNGLRAIALGTGENDRLEIPHMPHNADIQEGDLLVTSGLGQRFPAGYPVAKVSRTVSNSGDRYAEIEAQPTAHLNQFREVLLIWPNREKQ